MEMSTECKPDDFDAAMADVRGAFRLLYTYNRLILDLMKYISARLDMPYAGGLAKYGDPSPGNGEGNLDNWAWDWLNMYFYEFHFRTKHEDIGYSFSILLQSDTGFWDSSCDELDIDRYTAIEKSKTRLIFILGNNYWNIDYFKEDSRLKSIVATTDSEFKIEDPNGGKGYMLCKMFDIKDFKDRNATEQSLKKYVNYLNRKGITAIKLRELD